MDHSEIVVVNVSIVLKIKIMAVLVWNWEREKAMVNILEVLQHITNILKNTFLKFHKI